MIEEAEDIQPTDNSQPNLISQKSTSRLQIKKMSTVTNSSELTVVVINNIDNITQTRSLVLHIQQHFHQA